MNNLTNKDKYRALCLKEFNIPIFSKDWWLDAVCGEDNWGVAIIDKENEIIASMPYFKKRRLIFDLITMPQLTQTMGPWFAKKSDAKYVTRLSNQHKLMQELIDQIPRNSFFSQNFHYSIANWLPFKWNGFQQTTNYTYVIPDLSDLDKIWKNMRENIKTDIRKAEKNLTVHSGITIENFYNLNKKTFSRQDLSISYDLNFLRKVDDACQKHQARKIFVAEDANTNYHAAIYIVLDSQNTAYYLMGGSDPNLRNSGAMSLLMWEAIKYASTVAKTFDFEGSMIQPVERFFRAFGAEQKPYFHVYKTSSKLLKIRQALKDIFK